MYKGVYLFFGLDDIQGLDTLIQIDSTVDVGSSVVTLTIQNAEGGLSFRRKRGDLHEQMEHDILMLTNSSYYDLIFGKLT